MSKARSPRDDCSRRGRYQMVDIKWPIPLMLSRIRDTIVDVSERKHDSVFPGFKEMAERRRALTGELVTRRVALGLSQTEVAARMRTSQSAVARLESGDADVRLSTLERYAAALGDELDWRLKGSRGERR